MARILSTALIIAALTQGPVLHAQAGLRPLPSGRATSEVTLQYPQDQRPPGFQPLRIRVDYGQPHLRGRVLHTDSLVPYDSIWRTGANASTTLSTDVDLVLGGVNLPKGRYQLMTLPSRKGWKLIVQEDKGQLMADYSAAADIARIDLKQSTLPAPLESLTFWLIPSLVSPPQGELRLAWGTTMLSTTWMMK